MNSRTAHLVGAGPVGLATALLLAQQGWTVRVYEARPELSFDDQNSYPIGVNLRGQETLRRIDPQLLVDLRAQGEVVAGFKIRAGRRTVASLESGTLIATTRARLTRLLAERAEAHDEITILTDHQLERIDLTARTLHFATPAGPTPVDAADGLVIACDGVRSRARASLEEQVPDFRPTIGDWGVKFRVLFSAPGASAPGLDPAWHHIFTSKGIYTATLPDGVWCVAVTAIEGDESEDLLLSDDPSDANIVALRDHLENHAPLVSPLLTREDLRAFFGREPFGGAVVRCPRVTHENWLALLGDAAHSVIPPTGEGVNSGLEDARIFADAVESGGDVALAAYDASRMPDLEALGEYAWHLKENVADRSGVRAATNVGLRVTAGALGLLGDHDGQVEERLFGPATEPLPYREAIGPWIDFRDRWSPRLRGIASVADRLRGSGDESGNPGFQRIESPLGRGRRLTVIGASSGTGAEVAQRALDLGFAVTCVSRRGEAPEGATSIAGDACDPEVSARAVDGADAVIITVGGAKGKPHARAEITHAIVAAMQRAGVSRLIVQTSLGAGGSARQLPPLLRQITPIMLKGPLADHDRQEGHVTRSGLDWTLVRPAGLTSGPATGKVRAIADDEPGRVGGRISRADVASFLLGCVDDTETVHRAIGLSGA